MLDLIFIATTIAFFALMLGYVSLCETLGRSETLSDIAKEARA